MRQPKNRGFSLVELLVVITVIGILMTLLLPAVQSVREAGRRTVCKNQLRQIGSALQQYVSLRESFPVGNVKGTYWSFMAEILPQLEQQRLYDRTDFTGYPTCFEHTRLQSGGIGTPSVPLDIYQCPSDPRAGEVWSDDYWGTYATGNYFGVIGTGYKSNDGILFSNSSVQLADIRDGLTATLLVGERSNLLDNLYGWWACGYGQEGTGRGDNLLDTELGLTTASEHVLHRHHFSSHHPGGAHFLMAGSSVHFVSYDADYQLLNALATRDGGETNVRVP